jgi:hypothetical protein
VQQVGEPQVQGQAPRPVREPLPGPVQDLVQKVSDGYFPAVERPLQLQDLQLTAGMVALEAEVRAEQPEEVLPPPRLHFPLKQGAGGAEVGAATGLALEDVILPDPLLVALISAAKASVTRSRVPCGSLSFAWAASVPVGR